MARKYKWDLKGEDLTLIYHFQGTEMYASEI